MPVFETAYDAARARWALKGYALRVDTNGWRVFYGTAWHAHLVGKGKQGHKHMRPETRRNLNLKAAEECAAANFAVRRINGTPTKSLLEQQQENYDATEMRRVARQNGWPIRSRPKASWKGI
jgi:hypothetical protein